MTAPTGLPETGFIRAKALLAAVVPVARATLHRWVAEGRFPTPVKLGPGVSAWRVEDVRAWMAQQTSAPKS